MRTVPSGSLESHEPTSARKQKRCWRVSLTESVSVLDIGMSELVESDDVKEARSPLSDTSCDNESLNAESIVGQRPNHQGQCPADERGVTRKYSLSDVDGDVNALKVISDIVGSLPRHPNDACEVKWHVLH